MSGVFAAATTAAAVLLFAPLARYIPKAALAGLLVVTAARLVDWNRLRYAMRTSRYDAGLVVLTAAAAVFISVEFSILIGVALSILLFVPRAARLRVSELVVTTKQVLRERLPSDPPCPELLLYNLEGELFFGTAPELDRFFEEVKLRIGKEGTRVVVLRFKRTRNPDMVCLELLQHFLQEMERERVVVLLCGVRPDLAKGLANLRFADWFPADRIFPESVETPSATLKAVASAYELLEANGIGRGGPTAERADAGALSHQV
jgi:sulfate permease, SulP family